MWLPFIFQQSLCFLEKSLHKYAKSSSDIGVVMYMTPISLQPLQCKRTALWATNWAV